MLEKFIKKDKNEELEQILDQKNIEEHAKNLLQSILYKIEVSYKDYKKAKVTIMTKDEYIEGILRDIQRKCNQIQIVKHTQKIENKEIQEALEKNKFYIRNNNIISYPMEKNLLYAIQRVSNNKKIVNSRYGIIGIALSNLINTGKDIDRVEPLRDFNGWSWTTIKKEIESVKSNLVYQTIRILLGEDFLNGWCQDTDGIIDYIQIMQEKLSRKFGEEFSKKIFEKIEQIAIINESEEDSNFRNEVNELLKDIDKKIQLFNNTKENIKNITENKKKASKEIKSIDKILSQDTRIKQEYEKINSASDLNHKVFSIRVLKQQLINQKQKLLNEIEENNYLLKPINYVKEKNKLIKQKEKLEVINYDEMQKKDILIEFEKLFLDGFYLNIKEQLEPNDIIKFIYEFRYFLLIPFDYQKEIKDVEELKDSIMKVERKLMKLAIEKKVIVNLPFEVMEHVFRTRIVILEELYYKISTEFEKYYVQIFDENISEEKFEIQLKEKSKINKKIKIFI